MKKQFLDYLYNLRYQKEKEVDNLNTNILNETKEEHNKRVSEKVILNSAIKEINDIIELYLNTHSK